MPYVYINLVRPPGRAGSTTIVIEEKELEDVMDMLAPPDSIIRTQFDRGENFASSNHLV